MIGTAEAQALVRTALRGRAGKTTDGYEVILLAGRALGESVERLAEQAGLSRQGVYDALDRAGVVDDPEGTSYRIMSFGPHLNSVLEALERAERHDIRPWPSEVMEGRVRRHKGRWVAEVGGGSTLRTLRGAHATKTDAVVHVLRALADRRAALSVDLAADPATAILAPLV